MEKTKEYNKDIKKFKHMISIKCNCLTKTPDPKAHEKTCPVWMQDRIYKLENVVKELGDASDKVHLQLHVIQPYLSIWREHGDLIEECRNK